MQRDINGRIDFLLKVTGASNAQLARALNFDASYISRIRAGKRGLPPDLPFIEPAADFFARNVREDYQAEALACEIGILGEWPADRVRAACLIARWMEGAEDEHGWQGESVPSGSASAAGSSLADMPGRRVDARVFCGDEGRREAALAFLARIADRGEPCELLLQSDEDTAWMYRDTAFVGKWAGLMSRLAEAGCTFTVVHTVSRGGNEMWEGVREWLPLYLTGAIRPYYYPRLRDGIRARSLFVARGVCALVSSSVQGMGADELCVMLDDPGAARALECEFDAYLALCNPLARIERPQSESDFALLLEGLGDGAATAEIAGAEVRVREGHGALIASAGKSVVYCVDEPRLVDAIASYVAGITREASTAPGTPPGERPDRE